MTSAASAASAADGLLFVYSEPGAVPAAEFNDWYDNEHGPARLTVPGISAGYRFQALDGQAPHWLAYYEMKSGVLDSPEYKALWAASSAREKSIMSSLAALDRRVYELISDSGPAASPKPAVVAPAVVLAVSQSCRPPWRTTWRPGTPRSTSRCCSPCPAGAGHGGTG